MAVMIKNMEMPKSCDECLLCDGDGDCKWQLDFHSEDCPLVEIEEPKTGHWIDDEVDNFSKSFGYKKFHCSSCNSTFSGTNVKKTDYCPNCGAKMGVEDGECK